jgi:signal transduction histidine kinase
MDEKVKIKIFLASPMDLSDERLTVKTLIEDVTQKEGAESGFELELIGWEDHTAPAFGVDAQDVVNEQILEYDVIVCLFKERLGTPTKRAASGTVEEYERAKLKRLYNKNLRIMAYFIEHPSPQPGIGELKRKMGNEGALYWDVKSTDDFSALVRKHLVSVAEDYLKLYREQKLSDTNSRPRNSSYLAIVYEPECRDDGEPEVLILQRSLKSKTGPGQWQLPGGKSEEGETPKETAIREVREGAYSSRARVPGRDEIAQIAQEFNSLTDRLQVTENTRRRFVSDASHELKTPLAAIRLLSDSILQAEHIDLETTREFVADIGQEAERLSRITEDLLRLSRFDSGILEAACVVDVLPVLEQVMRMMSLLAQEKGVDLTYDAAEGCNVFATRDEIHQVIYNLVDNAVKFCPEGGALSLRVTQGRDKVYLTVSNDGEVIPPEELPLVFDRFHKMDKSRARNRDSWGLGLYIVRTLIDSHGENISVTSRDGKTAFTFTLPLVN